MRYRVVEMMNDMFYIECQQIEGKWFPVKKYQFGFPDSEEAIKQMRNQITIDKTIFNRNTLKRVVEESLNE